MIYFCIYISIPLICNVLHPTLYIMHLLLWHLKSPLESIKRIKSHLISRSTPALSLPFTLASPDRAQPAEDGDRRPPAEGAGLGPETQHHLRVPGHLHGAVGRGHAAPRGGQDRPPHAGKEAPAGDRRGPGQRPHHLLPPRGEQRHQVRGVRQLGCGPVRLSVSVLVSVCWCVRGSIRLSCVGLSVGPRLSFFVNFSFGKKRSRMLELIFSICLRVCLSLCVCQSVCLSVPNSLFFFFFT